MMRGPLRHDRLASTQVKRGGERTTLLGVSSTAMAAALGALCVDELGWEVALKALELLELLVHASINP